MNDLLMEPLRFYEEAGRALHKENTEQYFEELLTRSGVNVEENRATVKAYREAEALLAAARKRMTKYKVLRVLLIIAAVIGGIVALCGLIEITVSPLGAVIAILVGVGMLVGSILLIKKKINPLFRQADEEEDVHLEKANELRAEAERQMAPLNALFDDTDTFRLIEKTVPEFSFDCRFTKKHEALFVAQHDFVDLNGDESSMTNTIAGSFAGNPFLYCRRINHVMGTQVYHGSLTISWTETYRDSDGKMRTRRRTQTLHASVEKPKPSFYGDSYLCYGAQAAPELSFSRTAQHSERLSEKELEKKIRSGEKRLQKMAEDALEDGRSFQEMTNAEFDVLFDALDRDHEVQFRLMYTPLAQRNTVALLTSKSGYGDDFSFVKKRRFNVITSEHAQQWSMNTSARNYYSFDVDEARKKFCDFNNTYFKSVFFDFAPLISVPAYAAEPCAALEDIEEYDANYTYYEHEVMANAIGPRAFVHERSRTDAILKTELVSKEASVDTVAVTAYSYATAERVDIVPRMGGDGRMHGVPVPWIEYIPVKNTRNMTVSPAEYSERELRERKGKGEIQEGGTFFHGMEARAFE